MVRHSSIDANHRQILKNERLPNLCLEHYLRTCHHLCTVYLWSFECALWCTHRHGVVLNPRFYSYIFGWYRHIVPRLVCGAFLHWYHREQLYHVSGIVVIYILLLK